jgi:predicted neutral ceramidase superfamily lipid hydrolase
MEDLMLLKVRLSVLWLITEVGALATIIMEFYLPGMIDQIRTGEKGGMPIGPEFLLLLATLSLVPLVMAFLSLTLKDKANRWANIILGIVYTVFAIAVLAGQLANQSALAILPASGAVFSALIVWYAYKWPKG